MQGCVGAAVGRSCPGILLSRKDAAKKEEFESVFMEFPDTNHWKTCLKFITKTMY